MKRGAWHSLKNVFCSLGFVLIGLITLAAHRAFIKNPVAPLNNNPQQFHVWPVSNSLSSTFNCDPRAVDDWLFRSAGGKVFGTIAWMTNPPAISKTLATNPP